MLSIKHIIIFSTLFCLSSVVSAEEYNIYNVETEQILDGDRPWRRISAVHYNDANYSATLFNFDFGSKPCTLESVKFKGKFIYCLGQGIPCYLFSIPTIFHISAPNSTNLSFADSNGLRLTVGKTKENYVSLEQADATLNQRFSVL